MEIKATKNHHEYEKVFIGDSDRTSLTMVGCNEEGSTNAIAVEYGEDAFYQAYIVDYKCIIPDHYKLIASFNYWMDIFDDTHITRKFKAGLINVYRAGMRGTIIQLINKRFAVREREAGNVLEKFLTREEAEEGLKMYELMDQSIEIYEENFYEVYEEEE